MGEGGVGWGRGEGGLVGGAGGDGLGEALVEGLDGVFGAVGAVGLFVALADEPEGVEDVVDLEGGEAVEVKKGGVELGAELEAAVFVPAERGAFVAVIAGECGEIPGGVDELEHAGADPLGERLLRIPRGGLRVGAGGEDGELFEYVILEVGAADLLAGGVVEDKGGEVGGEVRGEVGGGGGEGERGKCRRRRCGGRWRRSRCGPSQPQ
jgi:hypothetical protein